MSEELMHYGTKRHSGRYPWGSGKDPYQRYEDFYSKYKELQKSGKSNSEITKYFRENVPGYENFTSTDLMAKVSISSASIREDRNKQIRDLKAHGYSNMEIGRRLGINESLVRSVLTSTKEEQASKLQSTANILKANVDKKGFIDIGPGVENELGVTATNLKVAAAMLKDQGYQVLSVYVKPINATGGNKTTVTVLAPPGTEWKDVQKNIGDIHTITDYSPDGGLTFNHAEYPSSISSDRISIKYGDQGGVSKDGVIEIRRGVKDLSLGNANYAQVRIAVDGTHYLKGMAMYSDDIPKGYDIVFNTNKESGTPLKSVLKELKADKDMPFGADIRAAGQSYYPDKDGEYVKTGPDTYRKATKKDTDTERYSLSAINKLREEGEWSTWSKTLSSQFLSKQNKDLIKTQLDYTYADAKNEFDKINSLTNPVVKQKLLDSFADDCDSSAVELKSISLPRQASKVILPVPSMPENQIYAPSFKQGEKVVLVRYPHAGTFEIPELIVNNKHEAARKALGNALDAVGINEKVAEQLSGADFDGDTVVVIPVNSRVKIKTSDPLPELKGFNPKEEYKGYEGMPKMAPKTKQTQMGIVSNLITDMTIKGAKPEEIARAVKHSMVVIDAEKHHLNYKQSEIDNRIGELKKLYQDGGGASTLISKASSEKDVPERKYNWRPDPETGKLTYTETGRTYTEWKKNPDGTYREGKTKLAMEKISRMADTDDAFTLSSGSVQEELYATYANRMKDLANQARKESMKIQTEPASPSAKQTYSKEVESLVTKLNTALRNAPRERQAQIIANQNLKLKYEKDPALKVDKDKAKKVKQKVLADARARTNAKKALIDITPKEWEAIQARAVSATTLRKILNNTDMDKLKELATPRDTVSVSNATIAKLKAMKATGYYTIAEMADAAGVSTSTVSKYLNGSLGK